MKDVREGGRKWRRGREGGKIGAFDVVVCGLSVWFLSLCWVRAHYPRTNWFP